MSYLYFILIAYSSLSATYDTIIIWAMTTLFINLRHYQSLPSEFVRFQNTIFIPSYFYFNFFYFSVLANELAAQLEDIMSALFWSLQK